MGWSTPAATGAKVVCPEKRVTGMIGDGGFVMTVSSENVSRCSSFTGLIGRTWPRRASGTNWPVAAWSKQPCTSNSAPTSIVLIPPNAARTGAGCNAFFHTCSEWESLMRDSTIN